MSEDWIEIVPPLPQAEADRKLEEWRKTHQSRPEDLRRDQVFAGAGQGCLVRYLVRRPPAS